MEGGDPGPGQFLPRHLGRPPVPAVGLEGRPRPPAPLPRRQRRPHPLAGQGPGRAGQDAPEEHARLVHPGGGWGAASTPRSGTASRSPWPPTPWTGSRCGRATWAPSRASTAPACPPWSTKGRCTSTSTRTGPRHCWLSTPVRANAGLASRADGLPGSLLHPVRPRPARGGPGAGGGQHGGRDRL